MGERVEAKWRGIWKKDHRGVTARIGKGNL